MAKIILNVELAKSNVVKNLKELEAGIQGIGKSLGDVKVNKNLTAQLNALTRQYNALAKAAKEAQKVDNKQAIEKEKLAKATAQASTAKINEQKATVQLQTAQVRLTKAQESGTKVVKKSTEENEKHRQSILSMAKGFFQWQMAATLVMKPLQMVRNAWASINETLVKTEDAVISIQRVLNDDSLSDSTISGKLYDLAQRYGQTFENVNDIAQNFARTGMSWNETIQATESALLALNVAELDATQASDGMIAIMQQFGYEASELTGIIDMLNKTADNFAVTTDKLLTALQRTGSSASNANLSLAETVGLITALSEATGRSGENLGTAINSLIQYSSKETALNTFASLDQNTADIVDKYRKGGATILDVWMAVSGVINNMDSRQEGILAGLGNSADITDLNQELQDELGDIFETVSDVYGTANTFRKNYFIALLGNMQTVQDAIETASDASGYSQKENEKYLDTYTAKVNTLQAKWQEVANDEQGLLGIKKDLVEMGVSVLDVVEGLGGIKGVLNIGLATLSPFIAKWTIAFGSKGIASVKAFWSSMRNGALTTKQALGAIGLILGTIVTVINVVDSAIDKAEEAKKQWMVETNQLSETALNSLDDIKLKIENVSKGYLELAENSDAYTKTLTEQEKVQKNIYEQNQAAEQEKAEKNALKEAEKYLEDNYSAIYNADQLLTQTYSSWDFLGRYGLYSENPALSDKELDAIIEKYGIKGLTSVDRVTNDWEFIKGIFGYEGNSSGLKTDGLTLEQKANLYQQLFDALTTEEKNGNNSDQLSYTKSWLQEQIKSINESFSSSKELLDNVKPYQDFVGGLISYEEFLQQTGILEKTEEVVEVTQTWEETLNGTLTNYKDLLDYITEIRDKEKEINDLEEKQLAVEKAKQALEDARNNKNVRVYNAATGTWELQADEKAIADAEEKFENAEEAYEEALLKSMEDEKLTVGQILEKVEGLPDLTSTILGWLKEQGYDVPDNLMFGSSTTIPNMTSGMSSNVNNSSNDNRTYMVNGVPITQQQAETYTIAELFEEMGNLDN